MGTRSLTYVYDENDNALVCMYRQFDGYPSVHGTELASFLQDREVINGIAGDQFDTKRFSNGMGCLAAQLVAFFKSDVGGFYLYPTTQNHDCWQDYEYHVYETGIKVTNPQNILFEGSWADFADFCSTEELA
jgi:hypothetical protein